MKIRKALVLALSIVFVAVFAAAASPARAHGESVNPWQYGLYDAITSVEQQTFDSIDGLHDENTPADILVGFGGAQNNDLTVDEDEEGDVNDGEEDESNNSGFHLNHIFNSHHNDQSQGGEESDREDDLQ